MRLKSTEHVMFPNVCSSLWFTLASSFTDYISLEFYRALQKLISFSIPKLPFAPQLISTSCGFIASKFDMYFFCRIQNEYPIIQYWEQCLKGPARSGMLEQDYLGERTTQIEHLIAEIATSCGVYGLLQSECLAVLEEPGLEQLAPHSRLSALLLQR
jgi:hypothetical protein